MVPLGGMVLFDGFAKVHFSKVRPEGLRKIILRILAQIQHVSTVPDVSASTYDKIQIWKLGALHIRPERVFIERSDGLYLLFLW